MIYLIIFLFIWLWFWKQMSQLFIQEKLKHSFSTYLYPRRERARRAHWWYAIIFINITGLFMIFLLNGLLLSFAPFMGFDLTVKSLEKTSMIHVILLILIFLYIPVQITIKRLYDLEKGYILFILFSVPVIFWLKPSSIFWRDVPLGFYFEQGLNFFLSFLLIYSIINIGFIKGTDGPNKYGPDPLKGK